MAKKKAKNTKGESSPLKPQHKRFAEIYFANGLKRVTASAIEAGYSEKSAHVTGSRLLKNAKIRAYIDELMGQYVMSRNETLFRLGEHAKADLTEFAGLSLEELKNHPRSWLIKKMKRHAELTEFFPGGVLHEDIELEVVDSQGALKNVGQHYHLLDDGVTINFNIELVIQVVDALKAAGADPEQTFRQLIEAANARTRVGAERAEPGT